MSSYNFNLSETFPSGLNDYQLHVQIQEATTNNGLPAVDVTSVTTNEGENLGVIEFDGTLTSADNSAIADILSGYVLDGGFGAVALDPNSVSSSGSRTPVVSVIPDKPNFGGKNYVIVGYIHIRAGVTIKNLKIDSLCNTKDVSQDYRVLDYYRKKEIGKGSFTHTELKTVTIDLDPFAPGEDTLLEVTVKTSESSKKCVYVRSMSVEFAE